MRGDGRQTGPRGKRHQQEEEREEVVRHPSLCHHKPPPPTELTGKDEPDTDSELLPKFYVEDVWVVCGSNVVICDLFLWNFLSAVGDVR